MSLGSLKKSMIEITTKGIIKEVVRDVDITLGANPHLALEEALRTVDKKRGVSYPNEQDITKDLYSLFVIMVWKSYAYERASDPDTTTQEVFEFVTKIAYEYMDIVLSKTKNDYDNLNRKNLSKTKETTDGKVLGVSMICRKCGHVGFDYDQYWTEYTCNNCGWQTR